LERAVEIVIFVVYIGLMKQKYYIDTSVFGGYFDEEFETITKFLFNSIIEERNIIPYSELTENELENAPQKVKDFIIGLPKNLIEFLEISSEAIDLADKYISENVVGKTSRNDCIHIALATLYKADVLISWNFRHIVNFRRIRGYNSENLKFGYAMLEIRSPQEMISYENEK
jgi:predicted nucleic acid-binding protein